MTASYPPPEHQPGRGNNVADDQNEGEGSRTAARAFNKASEKFAKSGKVDEAASAAKCAVDGAEGSELKHAEAAGKARTKGEDPAVSGQKR